MGAMIGQHGTDGRLDAGIHTATFAEFVARFGYNDRRATMIARVRPVLQHLADCGCFAVMVGGSFVTTKEQPKDIDFCWATKGVDYDLLHPAFAEPQGHEWLRARYGADIFPSSGIEADSGEPFAVFFQHTRDGEPTGVVVIDLATLPEDEDAT